MHPLGRPLRRARPVVAENGQLNDINNGGGGGALGPSPGDGLGTSFRRTIHALKDRSTKIRRSKSLTGDKIPRRRRTIHHSRSLTDVGSMAALQAGAGPPPARRVSAHPRRPALSIVAEGVSSESSSQRMNATDSAIADPPSPVLSDIKTLQKLRRGTWLTKVSAKKHKVCLFRLEADLGQIVWVSKAQKIIPIENIKEIRSGDDARYNREHLHLAKEYQGRWLTIIYILDGNYKTLHLIAPDDETFQMWDRTLRDLHNIRQELMRGLGNGEMRQALWEKQYWKTADEEPDHKLSFTEIEGLCRKLNINTNREDLLRLFKQADHLERDYLDFDDFRRFVKFLKARPEIDRLYKKLRAANEGNFDFSVFEKFMKGKQMSTLDQDGLQVLFTKYSSPATSEDSSVAQSPIMTVEGFTSFLLSPDNSAVVDIPQTMTRPLPEYYISSSHNTYLVGHQLVGASSTEGYIRALLHGCRSVEVDIYDGESEPMIFHGKTFTSKVSLREVCKAIMKYGFSSSPYPIIISAEVHCSVPQQDLIAGIMIEEFGDTLVRMPIEGLGKIAALPSPEDLKGKILLKAKNQDLARMDSNNNDPFFSEMSSSASESEGFFEISKDMAALPVNNAPIDSSIKDQVTKARTSFMNRVKSIGKKPPPTTTMAPTDVGNTSGILSPDPTPPSKTRPGLIQRARRSLRGSSSSASDVPSVLSETSTSSVDVQKSQSSAAASQPAAFIQRMRMGKSASVPEPPLPVSSSSPINMGYPSRQLQRTLSAERRAVLTPETVFAQSPPSLSDFSLASPPPSASFKSASTGTALAPTPRRPSDVTSDGRGKPKMSFALVALLVYTVGVKCRGINKKEEYAPEHMFSLSEKTANKMLRFGMWDLVKHTKTHLVRTYPKGTRVSSTNYEPHRFWAAGAQLVALNWQTFDLGYMINHAMFQRNGCSGYVLKPDAIRLAQKELLTKRAQHILRVKVISGQQLPRPKDAFGREIGERQTVDPYVEVTLFVPDWPLVPDVKERVAKLDEPRSSTAAASSTSAYSVTKRTSTVKKNGFNPVWEEDLGLPFDCAGEMMDLIFVRFMVKQEVKDSDEPLAVYCTSLGSLQQGYRHLPLHDSQMSQYLFSTLFVRISIIPVPPT